MKVNAALKLLRKQKGVTQAEAAEAIGVSLSMYQKYERNKGTVLQSMDVIIKIADYYDVTVDYILGREKQDFFGRTQEEKDKDIIKRLMALDETKRNIAYDALVSFVDALESNRDANHKR